MTVPLTPARRLSYGLFLIAIAAVCLLKLGNVLLAGLFSYMILNLTHRRLRGWLPALAARWLSVLIFFVTAAALADLFAQFIRLGMQRMPVIIGTVLPNIDALAMRQGIDLPFENLQELRAAMLHAVRDNARSITATSGLLTRGFFQIVVGLFIAVARFLSDETDTARGGLGDALGREFSDRMSLFMACYEKVLGAQVVISLINTAVTALYIAIAGVPYIHFLTLATFILGIIPLVGNIASNTLIIGAALAVSPQMALGAFIFLVVSHKAQYLLNSRIIGSTIKTPMWMTLLGLLIGEVILGVPGLILAPALLAYARQELADLPQTSR